MAYSIEPAHLVRDELIRKIILASTDIENQWFFSNGAFNANLYITQGIDTWNHEEFAVIHDKQIIAYFSATWDRPLDIIQSFRMIFFDKNKSSLAVRAFFKFMDYLFICRGCQSFNWIVAVKNIHAVKVYDKFISRYFGRRIGMKTRGQKSYTGEISDVILYEVTRENYFAWKTQDTHNGGKTE